MYLWPQAKRLGLVFLGLFALLAGSLAFSALGSRNTLGPDKMAAWMFMAPIGAISEPATARLVSTHGVETMPALAAVNKDATAPSAYDGAGLRSGQPGSSTAGLLRYLRSTHAGDLRTVVLIALRSW